MPKLLEANGKHLFWSRSVVLLYPEYVPEKVGIVFLCLELFSRMKQPR